MTNRRIATIATITTAFLLLTLTACARDATDPGDATSLPAPPEGLSRVVLLGDSVAAGQGAALGAAFGAAGVEFSSQASDGGGAVVGPVSTKVWETLPDLLSSARPSTVIYQVTTYDWGTEDEQRQGYERLLGTVTDAGADLVLVSTPPLEPDDFYAPHMPEIERAQDVARSVAEASDGAAVFLDAGEVWGEQYQRTVDGVVERSTDGIHTCPQGAARFTVWLLDELATRHPGFVPPDAADWVDLGWADDEHFVGC